jgi:hypothetical protein
MENTVLPSIRAQRAAGSWDRNDFPIRKQFISDKWVFL